MGGSVFGIKEAFRTFSLINEKSSIPGHKTMKVIIQPLLIRTFELRVEKHEVIRILLPSAVTGLEGVSMK